MLEALPQPVESSSALKPLRCRSLCRPSNVSVMMRWGQVVRVDMRIKNTEVVPYLPCWMSVEFLVGPRRQGR